MAQNKGPDNAASLPAIFPPWLDRLQIKYMNPVVKKISRYVPGAPIIEHRGRKSGKTYETPVTIYRKNGKLSIALGHGKADWVKNVLAAGEADVRVRRNRIHITNPRILPPGTADDSLPLAVRLQGRRVAILVADMA